MRSTAGDNILMINVANNNNIDEYVVVGGGCLKDICIGNVTSAEAVKVSMIEYYWYSGSSTHPRHNIEYWI